MSLTLFLSLWYIDALPYILKIYFASHKTVVVFMLKAIFKTKKKVVQ